MKSVAKVFAYILIVIFMVLFFAPKVQLYYALEEILNKNRVVISGEEPKDRGFSLEIEGGTLNYDKIKVADLEKISISSFLFYNAISIESFSFDEAFANFIQGSIDEAKIVYAVYNPLHVSIYAIGTFGELHGDIALKDRTVSLDLNATKPFIKTSSSLLRKMKRSKSGGYQYESSF